MWVGYIGLYSLWWVVLYSVLVLCHMVKMEDEFSKMCPVEGWWWTLRVCGKAPNGLADCRRWCIRGGLLR